MNTFPLRSLPGLVLTLLLSSTLMAAEPAITHWSYRPVQRPTIPSGPSSLSPIDRFIRATLAAEGLEPSPEADRATLIRRLTFDLWGLPPTPGEIQAFVEDKSPRAYEDLVDRLLASPRFGERWARHWLDVVRYADSHGFEMNQMRPNAWRYRDWVIDAFNRDLPYDKFVTAQVAGDRIGMEVATGFLVAGPWDQVKSPDPVLTAQQRADELHDMVATTGSAFLGLTVGCARCHAHKFDPISQADYYAIKAVYAGVQHGERSLDNDPDAIARKVQAEKLNKELATIDRDLMALEPLADPTSTRPRRTASNPSRNVERFAPVVATSVRFTIMATTQAEPCLDEVEIYSAEPNPRNVARDPWVRLRSSGDYPGATIHRLANITDGRYGNSRSWISDQVGKGWVEIVFPRPVAIDRVIWGRDREGAFIDRMPTIYRVEATLSNGTRTVIASSDDRANPGQSPRDVPATVATLLGKRAVVEKQLREAQAMPMAYVGRFTAPEPTHRLHRGDPTIPKETVPAGGLGSIGPRWSLPETASDSDRRVALARWLTDPANPLTARVIVNRLWQHHFGTGLVETPSDFGKNGGTPSHPELLDWLASELVTRGWSLKAIHREIVLSATYRQASARTSAGIARDASNRLLWRYSPRRLEAETLRDSILAASGNLVLIAGGPGFDLFEPNANYVKVYTPKSTFGPDTNRRMIYWAKPRMQLDDTFGAFDCPDGGQIAPKRNTSTTPLQALNLLNSPFLVSQSEIFAERVRSDVGSDVSTQVTRAFWLALGRKPDATELSASVEVVRRHGLPALTRALFNANEFVMVD